MPHFFTDRRGGESLGVYESFNLALHVGDDAQTVTRNRAVIGEAQFMNQVHGDSVMVIDSIQSQVLTCDGLITTTSNLQLAVMVADCIPLLLISKEAVGAIHVGRAGLVNRIALKAIHMMRTLGAIDIHAILGPSICGRCYEVPFEMQQEVMQEHPRAFATTRKGTPALDLPKALIADLVSVGISYEASTICTFEDELYFSHRRQNPTGRFAGVVSL
ncbi:MAG: peptidoglycan editing factor PgeF [Candidatus Planktophila sp.]|nr:peptidoglycan editing factor PgeF [Candidatus Planktophila sp.]